MTLMHDIHSTKSNIIRSGNYTAFLNQLTDPQLDSEFKYLPLFLKARFLYDLCKFTIKGNQKLVLALLNDKSLSSLIEKRI